MNAVLPGGQMLSLSKTLEAMGYPLHGDGGCLYKKGVVEL